MARLRRYLSWRTRQLWGAHRHYTSALALMLLSASAAGSTLNASRAASTLLLDLAVHQNTVVAVGQRGHILRSLDQGHNFTLQSSPTTLTLTAVTFVDAHTLIAVGHHLSILRSTDSGESWQRVTLPEQDSAPWLDVIGLGHNTVIAVGAYGYYARSDDAGKTWRFSNPTQSDFHLNHIAAFTPEKLVLVGESGAVHTSTDGGNSWQAAPEPDSGSIFFVLPIDQSNALLLTLGGQSFVGNPFAPEPDWQSVPFKAERSLFGAATRPQDHSIWVVGAAGQLRQRAFDTQLLPDLTVSFDRTNRRDIVAAEWVGEILWTVGELGLQAFDVKGQSLSFHFSTTP